MVQGEVYRYGEHNLEAMLIKNKSDRLIRGKTRKLAN